MGRKPGTPNSPWHRTYSSLPHSAKLFDLADTLDISRPLACGHLEFLWCWVDQHAPDGDLAGRSSRYLEHVMQWEGESGALIDAMCAVGFLDGDPGELTVHDRMVNGAGSYRAALKQKKYRDSRKKTDGEIRYVTETQRSTDCRPPEERRREERKRDKDLSLSAREAARPAHLQPVPADPAADALRDGLEAMGNHHGWPPQGLAAIWRKVRDLRPVTDAELADAEAATLQAGTPGWAYFASALLGGRKRAVAARDGVTLGADIRRAPNGPQRPTSRMTRRDQKLLDSYHLAMAMGDTDE